VTTLCDLAAHRDDFSAATAHAISHLLILGALSSSACLAASSSSDAGTVRGDGGALTSKTTGTGCGTDGVTLCLGASECPSISVNQSVFPECGFYFAGGSVYLACLCSNYLCPIGKPANCDQAASLLNSTNEGTVCGKLSSGECSEVSGASDGMDAEATSDTSTGCDESCASMCAGEPDCIQQCGC
jgi:hypothetical protein